MPPRHPLSACLAAALLGGLLLAGCSRQPAPPAAAVQAQPAAPAPQAQAREPDELDDVLAADSGVAFREVAERFLTALTPEDNIDSPAVWVSADGTPWVIATTKATHRLNVYHGETGALLRTVAGKGKAEGELDRPNGVFVIDDLLLVVERDNRRVQVFRLPGFQSLGSFGEGVLGKPYGLWARPLEGGYEVIVSDAYMSEADEDLPPAVEQLDQRFQRFRLTLVEGVVDGERTGSIGETTAAGAIRIPESLWGDPQHDRLLLAEEDQLDGTRIKVYTLAGQYAGVDIGRGLFRAQAEGIALWQCADGSGYWIATDQFKDRSLFHVFDRQSLEHKGAFAGRTTANTDGIWLHQAGSAGFPSGAFYAVHDDQAVAAFDWAEIAAALGLRASCAPPGADPAAG